MSTSRALTTARSVYFPSTADSTMISSSIHAEMPQNLRRRHEQRMTAALGHLVGADGPLAGLCLLLREAAARVDAQRGERLGERGSRQVGHCRPAAPGPSGETGSSTVKTVPLSGSLLTKIPPPRRFMMP